MTVDGVVTRSREHVERFGSSRQFLRRIAGRPTGLAGLTIAGILVFLGIFGPYIAPYPPDAQDIAARLQGPSWSHLLGTDQLGRDLLSRLICGVRIELGVAVPAVLIALIVGVMVGMIAGYGRPGVDNSLVMAMDTIQSFPAVVLALVLLALLGPSAGNLIIVISVALTPAYARVARAMVMTTRQNAYIQAEQALGSTTGRIMRVHLLPNIAAPLLILAAMDCAAAITVEAGLSFLGVGVSPPTPSWGVILADGFASIYQSPWGVLWACLALMVTTLGLTMLGESVRDTLDPRMARLTRRVHRG